MKPLPNQTCSFRPVNPLKKKKNDVLPCLTRWSRAKISTVGRRVVPSNRPGGEDQLLKELQQSEAPRGAAELRSDDASVGEVSGLESG